MVTSATFHVHSLLAPPPIGGGGAPLLELVIVTLWCGIYGEELFDEGFKWRKPCVEDAEVKCAADSMGWM